MTYHGNVADTEWRTMHAHNGVVFVELVQPLSGRSMFHDYLEQHPSSGAQHFAYRLSVDDFEDVVNDLQSNGYSLISEVDRPIARMAFFDTYQTIGAVTEIM